MSQVYRVKLGDGSVIGPLDQTALRSWYESGLLARDTPTQLDGSPRWTPLQQAVDTRGWRAAATPARSAPARARPATPSPKQRAAEPEPAGFTLPRRALLLAIAGTALLLGAGVYLWQGQPASSGSRQAAASRIEDGGLDLALDLPDAWVQVEDESGLPAAPPGTLWRFSESRQGAFAYLVARRREAGSPAGALDAPLAAWKLLAPDFAIQKREAARVGERDVELCEGRRGPEGAGDWVRLVAWREGWQEFALVGWGPESRRGTAVALDLLLASVTHPAGSGRRLEAALAQAGVDLPHLDRATLERLMEGSQAQVLEPPVLLRRSYERLGRGLSSLSGAERAELGGLHAALYAGLVGRDRQRLADYIERAREHKPLSPADDQAVLPLLRATVGKLAAKRRARLQELFAKAVVASAR
jgi:hypothetical protein